MQHVYYEKMPHSTDKWQFPSSSKVNNINWCVTEKCHGANFSFLCDGSSINYARRNDILKEKEKFFGYKAMAQQYKHKVFKAFNLILNDEQLQNKYIQIENDDKLKYKLLYISIYGEMFGGFFPTIKNKRHRKRKRRRGNRGGKNNKKKDEIKQNDNDETNDDNTTQWISIGKGKKNKSKQSEKQQKQKQKPKSQQEEKKNDSNSSERNYVVQREILYCPHIEFYAFDIALTLTAINNKKLVIRKYMDYIDAIEIFKICKFFYAKPLMIGTFEDCCNYNYEFTSKIPNWLGLKPLSKEYGENLAEGIIVKPMKNIFVSVNNGNNDNDDDDDDDDNDNDKPLKRAIVKIKHPLFQERIGDFKHKYKEKKNDNNDDKKGDKDLIHIESVLNMVNNNRYQSVVSKYGNPSNHNHKFYVDKIVKDIFEDIVYIEENGINEWWETKIVKKPWLFKYIQMKLEKKAMQLILDNNGTSKQND